jgi:hypothetical protein
MQVPSDDSGPIPWLTNWDQKMVAHLSSIAKLDKPPGMQLLFFANTFPLAYHYALALKMKNLNPDKYIHVGLWNQIKDYDGIFYTNDPKKADKAGKCSSPVTVFNPRWAFVPRTLSISRIWDALPASEVDGVSEYAPQARDLVPFLNGAKEEKYTQVWIYTELKDLGDLVSVQARSMFPQHKVFFWEDGSGRLPAFETSSAEQDVLRLFVFGGPLSSYLLRKTKRYLPLALPNGPDFGKTLLSSMKLFVAGSDETINALEQYHNDLYNKSLSRRGKDTSECPPFFTVYRAYNELAWLLQHRSSFKDADEFAQCLKQHHGAAAA